MSVRSIWPNELASSGVAAELIRQGRELDAAAMEAAILRELDRFSQGTKATDDRTLIVLKRN